MITNPSNLWAESPVFTPSGKTIVFVGGIGAHSGLYIMNLDGSGLTQLTNLNANPDEVDAFPSLSMDGTKIAFARALFNAAGDSWVYNVYVVGIGGESTANAATQLTRTVIAGVPCTWEIPSSFSVRRITSRQRIATISTG